MILKWKKEIFVEIKVATANAINVCNNNTYNIMFNIIVYNWELPFFHDIARFQARPRTRERSSKMDGNYPGQDIPQELSTRGVPQRRSSVMRTHEQNQPWKYTQVQQNRRTVQNDGKH